MYLVKYSKGSWDDWHEVNVFVTESEEVAQEWIEKFNNKLEVWSEFFRSLRYEGLSIEASDALYDTHPIVLRYYDVVEINSASYELIEKR